MPVLLVILFVVVPLAELYVLYQVGSLIGILPTIALLLLDSILGTLLLRSQGRHAWRRFNEATQAGRIPAREVADGALIILGGAFLLTPGFLTDIIGLLLLIPFTRVVFRKSVIALFARRTPIGWVGLKAAPHAERAWNERADRRRSSGTNTGVNGDFVEGTAHDVPDEGDGPAAAERRRLEP
jgi:UPF0716 protein FxsA